jgi:hypothetical protein
MASFKPLTYEQWRQHRLDETEPSEMVDCPTCSGIGETECCECGNQRTCGTCDGECSMPWGELSSSEQAKALTRERYHEALIADAKAFAGWTVKDPVEMLVLAGFRVWTQVLGRHLRVAEAT